MSKKFITIFLFLFLVFSTTATAESTTAVAGQNQGQSISGLNPSAAVDMSGSFNCETKRGFGIPGSGNFSFLPFPQYFEMVESSSSPETTKYFGPKAHSYQVRPIEEILSYGKIICIEQLKLMAGDQWWKGWFSRDPKIFVSPVDPREPTGKYMLLLDMRPKYAYTRLGYVTGTAVNGSTVSEKLMARVALAAHYKLGANVVYFPFQGAERRTDPTGIGVNGGGTHSTINGGGEASSNVSNGMLSFSYGSTGYFDRGWFQATAFYVNPKLLPFPDNNEEGNISSNTP